MRRRSGFACFRRSGEAALGIRRARRRRGAQAPAGHREPRDADRARRGLRARDRGARAGGRICRCRCSATSPIPRRRGSNTASSTCAARSCTRTSCCAGKSSIAPPADDRAGLLGVPDADPHRLVARGRARLPRALAPASRQILRAAAGAAAVQAAHSWSPASTAISRSRPASATRTPAPTASPGEFYQLDVEMSFVTQEDVFAAVEPVLARRVRGVRAAASRSPRTFPRIPYARGDAGLRRRQARPAQSDQDRRRHRDLLARRRDVQRVQAGHQGRRRGARDSRRPAPRRSRARSSTSSTTGREGRARRGSATSSSRSEGDGIAGKGPIAKFLPPEAQAALIARAGLARGRRGVLRLRQGGQGRQARGRGAHPHRQ